MKHTSLETVDQYIAAAASEAQSVLNELRAIIRSAVPDAEEAIKYGVPFYTYFGEFVGFAVYARHVSFGYGRDVLTDELFEALQQGGYSPGKGTMRIRFDQRLPATEIQEILQRKADSNRTNATRK